MKKWHIAYNRSNKHVSIMPAANVKADGHYSDETSCWAYIQSEERPTNQQAAAALRQLTGFDVPNVEEYMWWFYSKSRGWQKSGLTVCRTFVDIDEDGQVEYAHIYANEINRDLRLSEIASSMRVCINYWGKRE